MSPERLGTALRELVDDVDDGVVTPVADELWAGGRRRRRTTRIVPLVAAACVAALVTLVLWPAGAPDPSVPAVKVDTAGTVRLTAYPDLIAKPPSIRATATPGVTAALVPGAELLDPVYAVSPVGAVTRLVLPPDESGLATTPSLSPDGRWVSRGPVLTDLVTGTAVPSAPEQSRLGQAWGPSEASWWSPDSRRVFVGTFNQGRPRFGGLVVGTDGSTVRVPLVEGGAVPAFAGWLDDSTLLAVLSTGTADRARLELRNWSLGDPAWRKTTDVAWEGGSVERLRAELSPDAARLLLTTSPADATADGGPGTNAMLFDPRTGAQLGMPTTDGTVDPTKWAAGSFLGWDGWGCRPVWNQGLPVRTDGDVSGFVEVPTEVIDGTTDFRLVSVSSAYGDPCVAFAGNELRGTPVTNHLAQWQERLWNWAPPVVGGGLLLLAGWAYRRRSGAWRRRPGWLPAVFAQRL